jgi:uncharacterized membrane protein YgdD (TMEM256/DUF423 family)
VRPNWIAIGCFSAALAVMLGAFGAHGLRGKISEGDLELWQMAVLYQTVHAIALVLFGLFAEGRRREGRTTSPGAGWSFLLGAILFCGALYGHALGAPARTLHLAPVGGVGFMSGWILFGISALGAGKGTDVGGAS